MRKRDQYRPDAPHDEVFHSPLFNMERSGRYLRITTNRTPEEQSALVHRIIEHRPELAARAVVIREELRNLIHKYNSLDLVARLIARDVLHDPNEYREIDSPLRPHFAEYLALLELEDDEYRLFTMKSPSDEDIEQAHELLEELFHNHIFHLQFEHVSTADTAIPTPTQQMRYSVLTHNILVRSAAYHDHWTELLEPLFSSPAVATWLTHKHLPIGGILKCIDVIGGMLFSRLATRLNQAKEEERNIQGMIKHLKRGGVADPNIPEIVVRISKENGKNRRAMIQGMMYAWAFYALPSVWGIKAEELTETAGVPLETAKAFLNCFSTGFGHARADTPWLGATHPLQLTPIIRCEENAYFVAAPHLLAWAIKPNLEASLKAEPEAPWAAYEAGRAKLVTQKTLEYLRDIMPQAEMHEELYYNFEGKRCELDGLLIFDRYLLLIEAKAGGVKDASRRGATKSLEANLKELVRDPSNQAHRAKRFIEETAAPVFVTKSGVSVAIDKASTPEMVTLAVTLENLAMFTADMANIKSLGLLKAEGISWTLYLPDLKIISVLLSSSPSEFWHYVRWRCSLFESDNIFGRDEIDWLGIYLKQGADDFRFAPESYFLTFSSYTTEIDDYFFYLMKQRSKPAPKPQQQMPVAMREIIASIESANASGYTEATELLLDLTFSERSKFGILLRKHVKEARPNSLLETPRLAIKLIAETTSADLAAQGKALAEETQKSALVLAVTEKVTRATAWAVAKK